MFSKKKKAKERPKVRKPVDGFTNFMPDYGMPSNNTQQGNNEDDADLEAELRLILGNDSLDDMDLIDVDVEMDEEAELMQLIGAVPPKVKKNIQVPVSKRKQSIEKQKQSSVTNNSDSGSDVSSADENDPDLLDELLELTTEKKPPPEEIEPDSDTTPAKQDEEKEDGILQILQTRLQMYQDAERKAKDAGESARARRFNRGIKTLEKLIKVAMAGNPVLQSEIPPLIATQLKPATELQTNAAEEVTNLLDNTVELKDNIQISNTDVEDNRETEKQPGELSLPTAPSEVSNPKPDDNVNIPVVPSEVSDPKLDEKCDIPVRSKENQAEEQTSVVKEANDSNVPKKSDQKPYKSEAKNKIHTVLNKRLEEYKKAAVDAKQRNNVPQAVLHYKVVKQLGILITKLENGEAFDISSIPPSLGSSKAQPVRQAPPPPTSNTKPTYKAPIPTTVLEALNQRLQKYSSMYRLAEETGNKTKMEITAKIVKMYSDAIKLHRQGKPIQTEKLPTPPGYPPIPVAFQI